nr:MAG TPA: zinc finger protein [Caudoviricetes sp.]
MCNHRYEERIEKRYYDRNLECIVEVRSQRCIFCGRSRQYKVYIASCRLPKF